MSVAASLEQVRSRIAKACEAAGRAPSSVVLVAVSKHQPLDKVLVAHDLGVTDFGENTAQGLVERAEAFEKTGRKARWHFIGRLQRNKVNAVLRYAGIVQTVDRAELAEALSSRAPESRLDVMVQVNLGREEQKGGVDPDSAVAFARQVASMPRLRLSGLMGIAPAEQDSAPFFASLAALSRELVATPEGKDARAVSMGMSDDLESAIAHGATHIRIGTSIFGERETRR